MAKTKSRNIKFITFFARARNTRARERHRSAHQYTHVRTRMPQERIRAHKSAHQHSNARSTTAQKRKTNGHTRARKCMCAQERKRVQKSAHQRTHACSRTPQECTRAHKSKHLLLDVLLRMPQERTRANKSGHQCTQACSRTP